MLSQSLKGRGQAQILPAIEFVLNAPHALRPKAFRFLPEEYGLGPGIEFLWSHPVHPVRQSNLLLGNSRSAIADAIWSWLKDVNYETVRKGHCSDADDLCEAWEITVGGSSEDGSFFSRYQSFLFRPIWMAVYK